MQVQFYPKRLLITAVAGVVVWLMSRLALGTPLEGAIFIPVFVAAGIFFDLFFTVNPAFWGRWRRPGR